MPSKCESLSASLSVWLAGCWLVSLSVCESVFLPVCLSFRPTVRRSVPRYMADRFYVGFPLCLLSCHHFCIAGASWRWCGWRCWGCSWRSWRSCRERIGGVGRACNVDGRGGQNAPVLRRVLRQRGRTVARPAADMSVAACCGCVVSPRVWPCARPICRGSTRSRRRTPTALARPRRASHRGVHPRGGR